MSFLRQQAGSADLVARVRGILFKPHLEWDVIASEPATIRGLYTGYVCILAAIGPVCAAIGRLAFGISVRGVAAWRPSVASVIVGAIVSYLLALVMVAVMALIIEALAGTFGGHRSRIQGFKVAAFSPTASWLANVFLLVPMLGIFTLLLSLYSLYLLYLGLPRVMNVSRDKALIYTILVIVVAIVLSMVVSVVTLPFMMMGYHPAFS